MPSNYPIPCCPLLLPPSIFPSIRVFSNESSPSNEYSGLISFRIDWFDLLAVQGTLKSLQRIIQLHFTQFHIKLLLQNKQFLLHITWHHRLKCNLIEPNIFRLRYSDFKNKCLPSKEKSIINIILECLKPNASGSMPRTWGGREGGREGEWEPEQGRKSEYSWLAKRWLT